MIKIPSKIIFFLICLKSTVTVIFGILLTEENISEICPVEKKYCTDFYMPDAKTRCNVTLSY